jgi:pimeloyl-ACP methyl ester carboxylesterase
MPFMTSPDGIRLKYEVIGAGPPLLLHLGAGCDSDLWRAAGYTEPLSRTYRCILFDHRGHGESDRPTGAEANHIDRFADDVVALLDDLDVESTAFWAYSNGIAVGLKVADRDPSRLHCLIGNGVIGRATPEQLADTIPRVIGDYREHGWEKLIAGFEEDEGEVPEWMKQRIRATAIEPVIGWTEARLSWGWSSWEALARVVTPALFMVGEYEDPDDVMAAAVGLMRQGRRIRVPGKGHITAFLDSEFVLPRVEKFLAATSAATA